MNSDPWVSDNDPFHDDGLSVDSLAVSDGTKSPSRRRYRTVGAVSVAFATAALVLSLAGTLGYGTVGLSAFAYLLAVLADLQARRSRHEVRNYGRLATNGRSTGSYVCYGPMGWLAGRFFACGFRMRFFRLIAFVLFHRVSCGSGGLHRGRSTRLSRDRDKTH